ncbi:MAG: hypothetical protein AAF790_15205, partial [Planctomycetota bacterium]
MLWLVGVDEAGYGPNLGPLVIGATAWRLDPAGVDPGDTPDAESVDLYDLLGGAVARTAGAGRIAVADSKRLYKPGGGLAALELAVLAAIGQSSGQADAPARDDPTTKRPQPVLCWPVSCWDDAITRLGADADNRRRELPWHQGYNPTLPRDASIEDVAAAAAQLASARQSAGVGPPVLAGRMVFPAEFNALVARYGTKGAALSHVTISLLRRVLDQTGGPARVVLDKHGGRNRYAAILQHHFPEHWIETHAEGRAASRYAWGEDRGRVTADFCTGGEAFLPTALASMTAKLLRELAMAALNAYWQAQAPGLRPTAGYPVDARRFRGDIARRQAELGIPDAMLW